MPLPPSSIERLASADYRIQGVVYSAAEIVPLMVLESHRGQEAQERAFREGKTKLNWPNGKHNRYPSLAVDLAPLYYESGAKIDWGDLIAFGRIMGVIQALGYQRNLKFRFGLDWDGDFRSVNRDPDESFLDAPHVELVLS